LTEQNSTSKFDYLVVADMDGVNNELTSESIESCFTQESKWDVIFGNQLGPYYDIWALRHKYWCPTDCWQEFNFLVGAGLNRGTALVSSVLSRQIRIPIESPWIEVDSAFGGIGIYKAINLGGKFYVGIDSQGGEVCEHVHFHNQIKSEGGRLFINPKFINAGYTEHTEKFRTFYESQFS
jgi:hypothetical protein